MSQNGLIYQPRGTRRLIYTSDPSNLAFFQVGRHLAHMPSAEDARADPARTDDLKGWVDELANNGIDAYAQAVFSQGLSVLFRSEHLDYDFRPQHQRFVTMIDSGTTPLEVLIEQAHRRGMEFIAKFRMSIRYRGEGPGARFILENRQWWLREFPGGLDYSFEGVRDFIFSAADEVVSRFDVDGLLFNYIRRMHCFPTDMAEQSQPVMTGFLRRVREMLDRRGMDRGKALTLGVIIPQTLAECHALGYDVPTWIREELIDYVCPCDARYSDFNASYEEFSEITRSSKCLLYPSLQPLLCLNDHNTLLRPENYRALAQNYYGAGADGVSLFNYQRHWARTGGIARYSGPVEAYPLALSYLRDLRSPGDISRGARHYRFHPLWGGKSPSGFVKNDRLALSRQTGATGQYRFRVFERAGEHTTARLYFTAQNLLPEDDIRVEINGAEVSNLRRSFHPDGRLEEFGRPLQPFTTGFIDLGGLPLTGHDNYLTITLTASAPNGKGEIVVDEVEVIVMPAHS